MKILTLVGSGEFTPAMLSTDRFLMKELKKNQTKISINVAIIPTASGLRGHPRKWVNDGKKHFQKLGVDSFGLYVVRRQHATKGSMLEKLKTSSIMYFSGGHPGYLQQTLKNTQMWMLIEERYKKGRILVGCSAGAMIMGTYVLANAQEVFDKEKEKPKWVKGFNLVPYSIFPHFDWVKKNKPKLFKKVLDIAPKAVRERWMGIDEDSSLVVYDEKNAKLLGKGTVTIRRNVKTFKYNAGKEFVI